MPKDEIILPGLFYLHEQCYILYEETILVACIDKSTKNPWECGCSHGVRERRKLVGFFFFVVKIISTENVHMPQLVKFLAFEGTDNGSCR